jgi:hypothetical protein
VVGVPLYYVIQQVLPPGHVFVDDEEQYLYQTRHVRVEWMKDQKQVAQIILSYVQPTNAYEYLLMAVLMVAHYEGEFQSQTLQNAHVTIAALEYQNQAIFSWESFSNCMAKAYG